MDANTAFEIIRKNFGIYATVTNDEIKDAFEFDDPEDYPFPEVTEAIRTINALD